MFEAVPDPRSAHGLRYDLSFLLTCLVAALLCNCESTEAVAQWCRDQVDVLRQVFGCRLFLTPSGSLSRRLLPQLDAPGLEQVLGTWIQATLVAPADEPLALDGKTVRGARSGEQTAPHLLADLVPITARKRCGKCGWTRKPTRSLWHKRCCLPCRSGIGSVPPMPSIPRPTSCASSMRNRPRPFCGVKGNQPTLYADLTTYFADPLARSVEAQTVDRRRGRTARAHHQGEYRDECLSRFLLAVYRPGGPTHPYRHQSRQDDHRGGVSHHHSLSR